MSGDDKLENACQSICDAAHAIGVTCDSECSECPLDRAMKNAITQAEPVWSDVVPPMSKMPEGRKAWVARFSGDVPDMIRLTDCSCWKEGSTEGTFYTALQVAEIQAMVGEARREGASNSTGLSVTQEEFDRMCHCIADKPFAGNYRNYYCVSEETMPLWERLVKRGLAEIESHNRLAYRLTKLGKLAVLARQERTGDNLEEYDTTGHEQAIRDDEREKVLEEVEDSLGKLASAIGTPAIRAIRALKGD